MALNKRRAFCIKPSMKLVKQGLNRKAINDRLLEQELKGKQAKEEANGDTKR